jgi:hypothetical protein
LEEKVCESKASPVAGEIEDKGLCEPKPEPNKQGCRNQQRKYSENAISQELKAGIPFHH